MKSKALAFILFLNFLYSGCSLDPKNGEGDFPQLKLILSDAVTHEALSLFSAPPSVGEFDCFGANITGPGIVPVGNTNNCTILDNFSGRGQGILSSNMARRGMPLRAQVPSGPGRTIDVYGFYPALSQCGGTSTTAANPSSGYFLGRTSVDVADDTTVVIPVTFSTTQPESLRCFDSNINGTPVPLSAAGYQSDPCAYSSGSVPVPTSTVLGSPYSGGQVTSSATEDGAYVISECGAVPNEVQVVEYQFDATAFNLAQYSRVRVVWKGRGGYYTGTCVANPAQTFLGGAGILSIYRYNGGGSPTLQPIGSQTTMTGPDVIQGVAMNPSDLVFTGGGNKFVVRMTVIAPGGTQCASVMTDSIKLWLEQ